MYASPLYIPIYTFTTKYLHRAWSRNFKTGGDCSKTSPLLCTNQSLEENFIHYPDDAFSTFHICEKQFNSLRTDMPCMQTRTQKNMLGGAQPPTLKFWSRPLGFTLEHFWKLETRNAISQHLRKQWTNLRR